MWVHDLSTRAEREIAVADRATAGFAWANNSKSLFVVGGVGEELVIWSYPVAGGDPGLVARVPLTLGRLNSGPGGLLAAEVDTTKINALEAPAAAGAPPLNIDPAKSWTWSPAYSPDGSLAMVSDRSGQEAIWLKGVGAESRRLTQRALGSLGWLDWAPDGRRLAFISRIGDRMALHVIDGFGADLANLPIAAMDVGQPTWSSDGTSLFYPARDRRGWRLWRAAATGSGPAVPVSSYGWRAVRASGAALFAVRSDRAGIWRLGETPRLITAELPVDKPEDWTIFRQELVFAREGDERLFAASVNGGRSHPFANIPGAESDGNFTIDPRTGRVVYVAAVELSYEIELFRLARR